MSGWRAGVGVLCVALGWIAPSWGRESRALEAAEAAYQRLAEGEDGGRDPTAWTGVGEALARVGPGGSGAAKEEAAQTLYRAALCFEKAFSLSDKPEDRARAVSLLDAVAARYPSSGVADDALLRAGRLFETQGKLPEARSRYERVLSDHPDGDVTPLAVRRLQELGKPSELTAVRSWSGPGYTRVVVDFSGSGVYAAGVLRENPAAGKPFRVFLDFNEAKRSAACTDTLAVGDGLLTQVRSARFDPRTVRVVLDCKGPASYRVFRLDSPSRVVIDLFRQERGGRAVRASRPERVVRTERPEPEVVGSRKRRIVLDPGHGGVDPGALGPDGTKEKDVVLAIARELGERLKARFPCEVRFTRDTDRTVPLEERTAVANAFGADLFVSIHANASRSPEARGTETYYLNRASDRASRALAARENASGEAGVSEIEHILADVLLSSKVGESRRLAETLQQTMIDGLKASFSDVKDLGVKRAPFYVLTGASMPAVLVETAFISNPKEVRRLEDPKFRTCTAEALVRGLERFVNGTAGGRKEPG